MRLISLFLFVFLGLGPADAQRTPIQPGRPRTFWRNQGSNSTAANSTCTAKVQRKSWYRLTAAEKSSYINSTLCLMNSPAKHKIPGAKTLWDELHYVHIYQSAYIHFVGTFLPWHRYYLAVHSKLLRKDCGYRGPMPYWDQTLDLPTPQNATIFTAPLGFGGNGVPSRNNCVTTGPFSQLRLRFTENLTSSTAGYCLSRNMSTCLFGGAAKPVLDGCQRSKTFVDLWKCLEAKPHIAGHWGVGGVMGNTLLSPGDPLFFLHHGFIDREWHKWQVADPTGKRLREIGGPNLPPVGGGAPPPPPTAGNGTAVGAGPTVITNGNLTCSPPLGGTNNASVGHGAGKPHIKALVDWFGDGNGTETTLRHTLWSAGILPNATVAEVMDLRGTVVCAEYV